MIFQRLAAVLILFSFLASACQPGQKPGGTAGTVKVLAVETYLADIAQNVAGDRLTVQSLMPVGADPHSFEPAPSDIAKVAECNLLIINGGGVETFLDKLLKNAGGQHTVIDASAGLASRTPKPGEALDPKEAKEGDPHFWLDPNNVIQYVNNIRSGLSQADPAGAETYTRNADAYIAHLKELDNWISSQVAQIPPDQRLLVTNHETFGYYADRYGFKIIGTIIPSTSSDAAPSAQELATLVDRIKATGVRAIFLETGTNQQLADQVSSETGIKVVADLYTHSTSAPGGPAPTYIDMMKFDTSAIVNALK